MGVVVAFTHEELLRTDAEARLPGFIELVATAIANAEALGGRIFLDSPPGVGTSLRVELPLTATNSGASPAPGKWRR